MATSNISTDSKILKSAIHKCHRFSDTKEFCGYLTSQEIVALIDAGVKPTPGSEYQIKYARDNVKKGIASPTWFYFFPNGIMIEEDKRKIK